jgi:uncharacterized protein (DUF433 family)
VLLGFRATNPHEPRIVLDPAILVGKPVVEGARIAVEFIIGLMADGWSEVERGLNEMDR